jgi:hypothetical protein
MSELALMAIGMHEPADRSELDERLLPVVARYQGVTRPELAARVGGLPELASAIPYWMASAVRRGLLGPPSRGSDYLGRSLTAVGQRRLRELASRPD